MFDVGCWPLDVGRWSTLDVRVLDVGVRYTLTTLDVGRLTFGCWMLDVGRWTLEVGRWTFACLTVEHLGAGR